MDDLLLRGHSCLHCQKLKLCEVPEEIFIDTNLDLIKYSRSSPSHMRFTGLHLSDLKEGARNGCSLGKYLSSYLEKGYPENLSPHDLRLYTDKWRFHGLIPLEKTLSSDRKVEFPMQDQYVRAPAHKGKYGEFLSYNITTDEEVEWTGKQNLLTRKPIVGDPLSDKTAAAIREWKDRCDISQPETHTICSRPSPKFVPTRLLEIVRFGDDQKPFVRLVDGKSLSQDTDYTALSYCWGGDLKNSLKESNKASYGTEIPWDDIPKTIQDAILTSYKLGIAFIWVDSLCIIQDSKQADKEIEIGQMTQVYTHAALTIAARRAPDAHTGFLHPRSLPSGTTIVDFRGDDGISRRCTLTFEEAAKDEDETFLDTRDWTLQEYLLSRRLLIIGSWTTTWSCRKERKGNSDGWRLGRQQGDPFQYDSTWSSSRNTVLEGTQRLDAIAFFGTHPNCDYPRPADHLIKWEWDGLVQLYTGRNLTNKTDRILAISGLAQIFSSVRGGEYAAGLWVKDMPETLLWENRSKVLHPRPNYQGPSWSWTAINGSITWGAGHGKNALSVDSIDCELDQPGAPFGSIKRGVLRATGPALDLEWKCSRSTSDWKNPGGHHLRYLMADGVYINAHIEFRPDAEEPDSDWAMVTLLSVKVHDLKRKNNQIQSYKRNISKMTSQDQEQRTLHLVGIGVGHSIAPPMHNHIAQSLGLPWTFYATECATLDDLMDLARKDTTAGLVVTMPYKNAIIPRLDALDDLAATIGACNNVYRDWQDPKKLRGTNTDWRGIKGCLLEKGDQAGVPVLNKPALIVGAGGASRAAVYALSSYFQSSIIYVLNRDEQEVIDLMRDSQKLSPVPTIIHVKEGEAKKLETPYYVVGTVPDFEPQTPDELAVRANLEEFLSRPEKGVLLDMCFKPRRTRMIKLAEQKGWPMVEGTHVIGYQIEEQWRLWAGEERVKKLDREGAWNVLIDSAEKSPGINF
ncbi:shikimate dehydrogenase [Fusarium napiforme]|uniref:Shikimate dehydrogenase n=1 Tax=Fusarium napiforme TaxID=42672 RepID=A0A8H5K6Q1_9HYPO|nr:shikimate dehydrogenase [Fusarium napiforme]